MGEALSFGQWLRHRRRELDLTQEELGQRVGCARITIRKIEADEMRPSKQLAVLLGEYLGVSVGEREKFIRFARGEQPAGAIAAARPSHNLPYSLNNFIGREHEIGIIQQSLHVSRLVTLTGAGGSGKTRLAIEVACQMLDWFPDGVWFVRFASLSDFVMVQQAVASALGIRETPNFPLIQTLSDYLYPKKLLLLFDNCEHLIGECARTAERLLQSCPQLQILATSREALNIAGEVQYYVPTLSLPDEDESASLTGLMQSEAVRLFIERGADANSGFALSENNAAAVAQICRRLDGIPLALELAAACVKALSLEQIAAYLDDRFRLLIGGNRTALPRQRTLLATIDWSHNLLSQAERVVLRRLSVFAGGWDLEAAEFVCTGEDLQPHQILESQLRLIEKSLIVAETNKGELRYHMLETIRQYALQKLSEAGEVEQTRMRHLEFFLAFGERAEAGFKSRDFLHWLDRMERERDNLRAAMDYANTLHHTESALRLVGSTFWVWWLRGPWSEGQKWAEVALAGASNKPVASKAKTLMALGIAFIPQTNLSEARKWLGKSATMCRQLEDEWQYAFVIMSIGFCFLRENKPAMATRLLEEALQIAREVNDKWLLAYCLFILAEDLFYQGNLSEGRAMLEESLGLIHEMGDHMVRGDVLGLSGEMADSEGDYTRALQLYEESLAFARELGDVDTIVNIEFNIGRVCQITGQNDKAAEHFKETLQVSLRSGKRSTLIGAVKGLGVVAHARGDSCRAVRLLQAGVSLFNNLDKTLMTDPMDSIWFKQNLTAIRAKLGEDEFSTLSKEGEAMTLEQVIQYALEGV